MHFFNPVPVMGLIELVRAITTSDDTIAFGRAYGVALGKTTVESRDRAGFIVNALLIPYLNGAIRMLEDGFATREDIDTAIHLGLNHPMGPLQLIDLIGLDTHLFIANVLFEEFKEPTFAPPPLLRRMVTAGRLGRKVGRGFYDYEELSRVTSRRGPVRTPRAVLAAVSSHEKRSACSRPAAARRSARSTSANSDSIAAAISRTERGFTPSAASPVTSGSADVVEATTGTPRLIASSTGRPNPSYTDG